MDFSFNKIQELFCDESGSTLRFMIPLCLLCNQRITLTGSERLFSRSLEVYEELCKEQGVEFIKSSSGVTLCGRLKSGKYRVRGDISSQFISGLMFALPLLKNDSEKLYVKIKFTKKYIYKVPVTQGREELLKT